MTPLIGITTSGAREEKVVSVGYDEFHAVPVAYVAAVRRAGGIPVLLPPGDVAVLDRVDGVIFAGGADLSPALYGGDVDHPKLGTLEPERDAYEIALIRAVLTRGDLAALFVCRGMQALNVVLGGTLHEHIPDVHPEAVHQGRDGAFWRDHRVEVASASRLAGIVGAGALSTRSGNHQGIKDLGRDLTAVAWAADGVAVAVEHASLRFGIGVQWHPETTSDQRPEQQRIFAALVAEAQAALGQG